MSDWDYCVKHDWSFLMPELLMCPWCAREKAFKGSIPEPLGDALVEYIKTLEEKLTGSHINTVANLKKALTDGSSDTAD